jgi:ribosomal protein S18 acetylase RimI-like enzyme
MVGNGTPVPMWDGSSSLIGDAVGLIRDAEWRDLKEIARLRGAAGGSLGRLDVRLSPQGHDTEVFKRELYSMLGTRSACILVAEDKDHGLVTGYVIGTVANNELFSVPRYGYVGCLYVDHEHRGRGLGDALADAVFGWFRWKGLTVAQVDVSCRDPVGRDFWESRGFSRFLDHLWRDTESEVDQTVGSGCAVRPARSDDSEAVVLLWKEMMDVHAAIDGRLSVGPLWRAYVVELVARWLEERDSRLLVAETTDGVIGFVLGGMATVALGLKASIHGHIAHLCVSSRWRRQGVGRQLVASLSEWFLARNAPSVQVYLSCLNPVSQEFWRGLGFEDYICRLWCNIV